MYAFLEELKQYLETTFANDSDFTTAKVPKIIEAYKVGNQVKMAQPQVQIQILDNSEETQYTTYCHPMAENISVEFTAYASQMKIGSIERSALGASIIIGDKIKDALYKLIYSTDNHRILYGTYITSSPALPMNDGGTIYMTAIRFEFQIEKKPQV